MSADDPAPRGAACGVFGWVSTSPGAEQTRPRFQIPCLGAGAH